MKKLLFMTFIALTFVACNKNQKAVKTLDGKWIATSYIVTDGIDSEDFLTVFGVKYEMEYENCKLKKDETCDITIIQTDGDGLSDVENGKYKVIDDGNKMELTGDNNQTAIYTIDELEETTLKLILKEGGLTATITLSKQ